MLVQMPSQSLVVVELHSLISENCDHVYCERPIFDIHVHTSTREPIVGESETISTLTLVRADSVTTDMLTSSVISRTLIDICNSTIDKLYVRKLPKYYNKPLHVLPSLSSVYPLLQEQVKDPSVLVQT